MQKSKITKMRNKKWKSRNLENSGNSKVQSWRKIFKKMFMSKNPNIKYLKKKIWSTVVSYL